MVILFSIRVVIRIGSTDNYTRDLLTLDREIESIRNWVPCPKKYTSSEYMFRNKGFHSDWCSFRLLRVDNEKTYDHSTASTVETASSSVTSKSESVDDSYRLIAEPFPKRDYIFDVLFCIVIPLIVGTMVVSSLTCIFFYNKEELSKVNQQTAPVQMQQYSTIQRASSQLRSLAQNRNSITSAANTTLPRPILKSMSPSSTMPKATMMHGSRTGTLRHVSSGFGSTS